MLPRVVVSDAMEMSKVTLDRALSNLIQLKMSLDHGKRSGLADP